MSSETTTTASVLERPRPVRGMPKVACHRGSLLLGPNIALAIVEASERSLGMFLSQEVVIGQEVSLTIESTLHLRPIKFTGKAHSCTALPNQTYRVSIDLDKRLEWSDLIRFT